MFQCVSQDWKIKEATFQLFDLLIHSRIPTGSLCHVDEFFVVYESEVESVTQDGEMQ